MHARGKKPWGDAAGLTIALYRRWSRGGIPYTRLELSEHFGWSLERVGAAFVDGVREGLLHVLPRRARAYGLTARGRRFGAGR